MAVSKRLTDSLVAPAIRLNRGEGLAEALRCLREFDPHIFLVFGGDAEDVKWLHETLEEQAGRPILFAADLERGAGQQFEGLTPLPDAWALSILGKEAAYDAGHRTACEATQSGVKWVLGPVLDLHRQGPGLVNSPIIAHRAFGTEVDQVAEVAGSWLQGLLDGGALSCAKHFPGHGASSQDSHTERAVAVEDPSVHLEPFHQLLSNLQGVMVGHLEIPTMDPEMRPASRSPVVVDILRKEWKYDGILTTDSLRMAGYGDEPTEQLGIESLNAGIDLLLDPVDPVVLAVSLRDAAERGDLDVAKIKKSAKRVEKLLKQALGTPEVQPKPLMLLSGARRLMRPLPGGSPGRQHPRPEVALALAATEDAVRFLEDWGVQVLGPNDLPPEPLPQAILVLWGAAAGMGMPSLPGPWAEAIHKSHPVIYIAGSPDAADAGPVSARGFYLPGLSPALLALLFAEGEE